MKNILITAHPRSGTHFTANLLNSMGYNCTYEKRNPNGFTSSWKHIKTGTFEPPCRETEIVCDFDKIIHQVRHPLKVIASSTTLWTMSMIYMATFIELPDPIVNRENTILNCMVTWINWNNFIEQKSKWQYRVEDLQTPKTNKRWCEELEIPFQKITKINKVNSRKHIELTWDDLYEVDELYGTQIRLMADRYGYEK